MNSELAMVVFLLGCAVTFGYAADKDCSEEPYADVARRWVREIHAKDSYVVTETNKNEANDQVWYGFLNSTRILDWHIYQIEEPSMGDGKAIVACCEVQRFSGLTNEVLCAAISNCVFQMRAAQRRVQILSGARKRDDKYAGIINVVTDEVFGVTTEVNCIKLNEAAAAEIAKEGFSVDDESRWFVVLSGVFESGKGIMSDVMRIDIVQADEWPCQNRFYAVRYDLACNAVEPEENCELMSFRSFWLGRMLRGFEGFTPEELEQLKELAEKHGTTLTIKANGQCVMEQRDSDREKQPGTREDLSSSH